MPGIRIEIMKGNDLRTGNLVLMVFENLVEVVTPRMIGFIATASNKGHGHPFEPIPLTEEWFIKCGYEKADGVDYVLRISALKMTSRIHSNICYSEVGGIYLGDRIKYVHELQNLYHSLTGNELTISL